MWMLHDILYNMVDRKVNMFYWGIHMATEMHGKVLNIIAIMNSGKHDSTNPLIK